MSENEAAEPPADVPLPDRRLSWFQALVRLWCLRRIDAAPRGTPGPVVAMLSLVLLMAWVAIDRWQRQPAPVFSVDGIPLLAWYVLGVMAIAALLRLLARPRPSLGAVALLIAGLTPLPLMLFSVVALLVDAPWFWSAAAMAALYSFIYLARGLRAVTGVSHRTSALAGVIGIVAFIAASAALNAIPDVWNPADAGDAVSDEQLAERESALFEQADRIDAALESIHRDASPASQGFFLGFAGVGDEKVFAQEIGLASRVLGERYGMADRGLSLVNDERDLARTPLANVPGLAYALKGLASRMDLEHDVLFLAISSHGSEEPVIEVSNSQFPFRDLTANDLAEALHAAGIQWRVIIISACYAGGFIDSLRNPQTIVITAAAADRTSFGCSNDSDLTYFGEAFYQDALPGEPSLREAFDRAKQAIAAREQAEGETPSSPQAYFGAAMEAKLNAMGVERP